MDQEIGEMHWRDGWMFKRLEDGSVRIRQNIHPMMLGSLSADAHTATIPPNEWVSLIHHLGKEQTAEAFQEAMRFHVASLEEPQQPKVKQK